MNYFSYKIQLKLISSYRLQKDFIMKIILEVPILDLSMG